MRSPIKGEVARSESTQEILLGRGHVCCTVQEAGWAEKQNGELLKLAETTFDVLVTLDTNLRYHLTGRTISTVVL
jgi:hypothetical protein